MLRQAEALVRQENMLEGRLQKSQGIADGLASVESRYMTGLAEMEQAGQAKLKTLEGKLQEAEAILQQLRAKRLP
jgi:hypothetical protein